MIVVKSTLNSEDGVALNRNALKKLGWFFILLSVIIIIFGIMQLIGEERSVPMAVVLFVAAILVPLLIYVISMSAAKKNLKTSKMVSPDTVQTFTFADDGIRVQQQNEHFKGDDVFDWTCIYSASETKDYMFIYISNAQSHIMKKVGFQQGSIEELRELLKEKIGSKFKALKS